MFAPFTSKYIDVKKNERIVDKLELAINSMDNNGTWIRYIPEDNTFVNVYDYVKITEQAGILPIYLHSLIIGTVPGKVNRINSSITNNSNCSLCDYYDFIYYYNPRNNFETKVLIDKAKIMTNEIVPTNLSKPIRWRNYIIVPNYEPYYENHFMIISLNHEANKIVGSQFEVLDYTTLYELLTFYKLNSNSISMLHNYAHIGSQEHLHLHFVKTNLQGFYDVLSDNISNKYFNHLYNLDLYDIVNIEASVEKYRNPTLRLDLKYLNNPEFGRESNQYINLDIELFRSIDKKIMLCKHSESTYGINGFLISAQKVWLVNEENFKKFVSVVNGFLNSIEMSLTHTFCQFWTMSNNYLNIYVVTQERFNDRARAMGLRDIESARNLRMDIFSDNPLNFNRYVFAIIDTRDNLNNIYYNTEFFNLDIVNNTFIEKINQIKNPIVSTYKYELPFDNLKNHGLFLLPIVEETLKTNKTQTNPYVLAMIGPYGVGKSTYLRNKSLMNDKFNIDINDSLKINIDDIRLLMPLYKNTTSKIKNILGRTLNRRLDSFPDALNGYNEANGFSEANGFTPEIFNAIRALTIQNLISNEPVELINWLRFETIDTIYTNLLNTPNPEIGGMSLSDYHQINFDKCHNISAIVHDFLIKEAVKRKINVVLETCNRQFEQLIGGIGGVLPIYPTYNKFIVLTLIDNSNESKKYVLRNLLERSFKEGRVIKKNDALNRITNNNAINLSYVINKDQFINHDFFIVNDKDTLETFVQDKCIVISNKDIQHFSSINGYGSLYVDTEQFRNIYTPEFCAGKNEANCTLRQVTDHNINGINLKINCIYNDQNIDENFEFVKIKFNNEVTNLILKNIINTDNIRTIMIYDFYVNYKKLLKCYIDRYNRPEQTKYTRDGQLLIESDIKIILKGGSSIRLDIIKYLDKIEELIKSLDTIKNIEPELLKLRYIFKLMINETQPDKLPENLRGVIDDYYNTFGKSDIDFTVVLNPTKFTNEENFNKILNDIEIIAVDLLYMIREIYSSNRIYFHDDINFLESFKNLFIKSEADPEFRYLGLKLKKVYLRNKELSYNQAINTLRTNNNYGDFSLSSDQTIIRINTYCQGQNEKLIDVINGKIYTTPYYGQDKNKYRISFNKSLKKILFDGEEIVEFDLLRLKLFTKFEFASDDNVQREIVDITGELIDISFPKYNDLDIHLEEEDVQTFNFKYPLYDFSLESYTIYKQIYELNKMLFDHTLNIWNVKKYSKRLNRYSIIIMLYIMKNQPTHIQNYYYFILQIINYIKNGESIPIEIFGNFVVNDSITRIFTPLVNYHNRNIRIHNSFVIANQMYTEGNIEGGFNVVLHDYLEYANGLNINVNISHDYIKSWLKNYYNYKCLMTEKLQFLISSMEILNNMFNITTEKISTIDDKTVNKWGGGIRYHGYTQKLLKYDRSRFPFGPKVSNNCFDSIRIFFEEIMPRLDITFTNGLNVRTYKFTNIDLQCSKVIGAGSFGYGLSLKGSLITNPLNKINLIMKIIPLGVGHQGVQDDILSLVKESFIPFKLNKIVANQRYEYNVFNENYLSFNFNAFLQLSEYSQILDDKVSFNKAFIDNILVAGGAAALSLYKKNQLRMGNIGYVLMNAGISSLSDVYPYTFAIYGNDLMAFHGLLKIPNQLLYVHTMCYRDRGNTIYITHNDIKPDNMIFGIIDADYYSKIIDHGANIFATHFFNELQIFTTIYRDRVLYPGCMITSPLFDLGSVAYSIIQCFIEPVLPNFYFDLNLENLAGLGARFVIGQYDMLFERIYILLQTIYPLPRNNILTQEVLKAKVCLVLKLLEILNIYTAIKNYYATIIRPEHNEMLNGVLGNEPKYKFYKFSGNDFEYWDIDTKQRIKFEGEDFDLYKTITTYVKSKFDKIDSGINTVLHTISFNIDALGLVCTLIPAGEIVRFVDKYQIYQNPAPDAFIINLW